MTASGGGPSSSHHGVGTEDGAHPDPGGAGHVVPRTVAHEHGGGRVVDAEGVEGGPEGGGVRLLERHLAGVEAGVDEPGQAVPGEEALEEGTGPVGVGQEPDAQAPIPQRGQRLPGLRVVADVGRPRVEVADGGLLQQRLGHVEVELVGGRGQQVGEGGAALVGGGGGPEGGLDRDQPVGELVLPVGGEVAGGQPPGVDQLGRHELGQRPAPVEDDRGDGHEAGASSRRTRVLGATSR